MSTSTGDGFYTLIPVKPNNLKKKKPKQPKFKKSSWKYWYYKRLKRFKGHSSFKCTNSSNFVVWKNVYGCGELKIESGQDKAASKELKLMKTGDHEKSNGFVLVDTGDMMYTKIPVKSYFKLAHIDKMIIGARLVAVDDDGNGSKIDVWQEERLIRNLGELFQFINFHRQGISGVYDIMANGYLGFSKYEYLIKIVVCKTNGSIETYKGDMNDFMKEYGLYQF